MNILNEILSWSAVTLLLIAATGLLLVRDWRWSLGLLAALYLGLFWLVRLSLPTSLAAAKLVTGWMSVAALGMTRASARSGAAEDELPQGGLFRLIAALLVALIVAVLTPRVPIFLPGIGLPEVAGSLILIGMGLLHLGITSRPMRVIIGLLTVLAGFEILYAAVEGAILVLALLVVINLGLALTGAYLLTAGEPETSAAEEEAGP